MNETLIVMALIVGIGSLPIIIVAIVAYRALKKSIIDLEAAVVDRNEKVGELFENIAKDNKWD